jgi:hypothetical protein
LADSSEQYHDYVQDFYENQVEGLREELNATKIELGNTKQLLG